MGKTPDFPKILLEGVDDPAVRTLEGYRKIGGYEALRKALTSMSPEEVIAEVKTSGLRGRGGAGFPTGIKWEFVAKAQGEPKYVAVNADEGEPGTFKDRVLMDHKPHMVIEGAILAAYAVGAREIYYYLRWEYPAQYRAMERAIQEAYEAGFLGENILGSGFSVDMYLFRGAGSYLCGEETALLNSLEGKRGEPRLKPPYPAQAGLYGKPTLVNNVETLAAVAAIVKNGGEWYRSFGTEKSPGTKLFNVSGGVKNPGTWEIPLGALTLRELVFDLAGGPREGREIVGIIPGGISTPILSPEEWDTPLDYESMREKGTFLGAGSVIVIDDSVPLEVVFRRAMEFFAHESCSKCTPCREGTTWLVRTFRRIEERLVEPMDVQLVKDLTGYMEGTTFCPHGTAASWVAQAFLKKYGDRLLPEHLVSASP